MLGRALSFLAGLAFAFNQTMLFHLRFDYTLLVKICFWYLFRLDLNGEVYNFLH
jgi:hypothetical protein